MAACASSYHAMQIRGKVTAKDESAGRDENYAGSNESALNTTALEEPRNSRRSHGRGKGRGHRGNGNTQSSATGNNNNGGYMSMHSNGNSSDDTNHHSGRGGCERGRNNGKNRHGRCRYCRDSTEHGWHDYHLRLSHQQSDDTQHATAAQVGGAVG